MGNKMKRFLSTALVFAMLASNSQTALASQATDTTSGSDATSVTEAVSSDAATSTTGVAKNADTGENYADVADALEAAEAGETIILTGNASTKIASVVEEVTLDLNGYTLEASYVTCFGNIVDQSEDNAGLLKVEENRFLVQEGNAQLPVKDEEGYRFFEVEKINTAYVNEKSMYAFQPFIEKNVHELVKAGAEASGVTMNVRVAWKQGDGERTQDFVFTDELVKTFLNSYNSSTEKYGKMFSLTLKGADKFENLTFNAIVSTTKGVEEVSDPYILINKGETEDGSGDDTETGSGNVTTDENNQVADKVTIQTGNASADVNEGTQLEENTKDLTLSVEKMDVPECDIELKENETALSVDVHVEGVAKDNTVPIIITIEDIAPEYLNKGNLRLYHVEDGETVEMTRVYSLAEVDEHNEFYYDPVTGVITMALATFSEVAVVSDDTAAWQGEFDYSWYTDNSNASSVNADYVIANADQLAAFGAIVGGMNDQTKNDFADQTIKLLADINIGDTVSDNGKVFYPIGYYNNTESYEKVSGQVNGNDVVSSVSSFSGVFDGNGHTISNFYQNTWEMFGDYNSGYNGTPNHYKDAMGLFGYVYGGTVKNLTVNNFSSDGEFTPTGVIAAYADGNATFENIAITNCNPRVYNTGNGGIVGIAGDTSAANDDHLILKNITVDNSNKISALWGSWDVACGGLVGMYRGNVDGSGNATGDTISFENCHVSAQIDVYNDVCANYQYYAYRYAGMIIGSVRHNTTNTEGKTIPNMAGISATGCTVNYGDWNDYYYCEFVDNSIASYTHDYQFSRVDKSEIIFDEEGNVTGCKHDHTKAGYETTDIDGDGVIDSNVLKEDKTAVYLPFHQLFTGYSWGVSSIGLEEYSGIVTDLGITEGDHEESVEKFETKFIGDFLYRVGNKNDVSLEKLFKAKDGADINDSSVVVSISKYDEEMKVSGTYTANTTNWEKGTIKFEGTGVVKVTIQDYDFCTPTEIYLEVVDATNLTSATGTTSGGNFVLLCDVNTSDYVYYYNSSLYGNGFTYSLEGAPTNYSSSHGHGVIMTKNSTLDNLVIVGDIYDEYGAFTTNNDYNAAIDIVGETVIQNCYISGCSAPVSTRANATIKNTTLYGGAVGNLIIKGGTVTLENVTTVNYNDGRDLVGMGIVIHSDATEASKLVLNGSLTQYNFIKESDTPSNTYAKNLHKAMFDDSCSQFQFNDDTDTYVNTGIISLTTTFDNNDISDNAETGYVGQSVSASGLNGYVYTQPNTSGSVNNAYDKENDAHIATAQGAVPPSYSFDHTTKNYVPKTEGSNDYCYEENGTVYISMDDGDIFNWDTSILNITKGNQSLDYTVSMNGIDYTGKSIAFDTAGDYEIVYSYTDPNNYKLSENDNIVDYSEPYTKTVNISVAVIEATTKHAEFTMGSSNAATEKITIDNTTYVSATGVTADNSTWTYITIDGQKIYYPIVAAKLTSTKGSSTYAYFPVFENVITITDYFDKGTGDAFTYNSLTTTLPNNLTAAKGIYKAASDVPYWYNLTNSNLTQSGASKIFKWASSSDAPSDPTIYNDVLCYKSPQISADRVAYITLVQYSYTDEANTTYYYYVGYTLEAFTKQSICVTPNTLVTMADGSQKAIEDVSADEEVLAWDFYTGKYVTTPVCLVQNHGTDEMDVLHLYFEDGTELKVLGEHGVFDVNLNTFIFIDKDDVENYIGHEFVKKTGDTYGQVKLVDYEITNEYTSAYTILSSYHYNVILEDMFTVTPAHVGDNFFNPFDIEDGLKYDEEKVKADIEKYGLYTYEDFENVLTPEQFKVLNLGHFKVSVGKELVTYDGLIYLIENFINQ